MKNKTTLKGNKLSAQDLWRPLSDFLSENSQLALTEVRPVFHYDKDKKQTEQIEAWKCTVTEMETLSSFSVRVNSTTPVITPEELEEAEERVFIEFPMEETIVKPYKLEYGTATVSIVAPYAKLSSPTDSEED